MFFLSTGTILFRVLYKWGEEVHPRSGAGQRRQAPDKEEDQVEDHGGVAPEVMKTFCESKSDKSLYFA